MGRGLKHESTKAGKREKRRGGRRKTGGRGTEGDVLKREGRGGGKELTTDGHRLTRIGANGVCCPGSRSCTW